MVSCIANTQAKAAKSFSRTPSCISKLWQAFHAQFNNDKVWSAFSPKLLNRHKNGFDCKEIENMVKLLPFECRRSAHGIAGALGIFLGTVQNFKKYLW